MEEVERDKEELRVFSQKLCSLLRLLLGERKMVQLGAPDVSPPDLLEKVLRLTGSKVTREDDLCSEKCKVGSSLYTMFSLFSEIDLLCFPSQYWEMHLKWFTPKKVKNYVYNYACEHFVYVQRFVAFTEEM